MPEEMYLNKSLHPSYNCAVISVVVGLGPANKMRHLFCFNFYIKVLQKQ